MPQDKITRLESNKLKDFIKVLPTFLLTISYFSIMVIGVTYSFFFYSEFDINIIKFVDLSDFLLAPILEPLSILIFVVWVVIVTIPEFI